jgi:hypothetical protein
VLSTNKAVENLKMINSLAVKSYTLGGVLFSSICTVCVSSLSLLLQHLLFQVGHDQRMHSVRSWYRITRELVAVEIQDGAREEKASQSWHH